MVQRSTAVPSGVVPKGSTVVLASPEPASAPAGYAAPVANRPALTAATSGQRRRRAHSAVTGLGKAVDRKDRGKAGRPSMGTPMSVAVHRRRRAVAGTQRNRN